MPTTQDRGGATVSLVISALVFAPTFLLSCIAFLVDASFPFRPAELGLVLSAFYVGAAAATTLAGAWVDRAGARRPLLAAALITAFTSFGCALANRWPWLCLLLIIAGAGAGLGGPAAIRLLMDAAHVKRLALLFAFRQSAAPLAAILASAFAVSIANAAGWRVTFGALGAVSVVACFWAARTVPKRKVARGPTGVAHLARRTAIWVVVGGLLMGATTSAFCGFVVSSAIERGITPSSASVLLAACSVVAILTRLAIGWSADQRKGGHLPRVAALQALGGGACAVLALSDSAWIFSIAALAVSATAWGSNGLFTFAIVNSQAHSPGRAAGVLQLGMFTGSAMGPFAFGLTAEYASIRTAWLLVAIVLIAVSAVMLQTRRTFLLKGGK